MSGRIKIFKRIGAVLLSLLLVLTTLDFSGIHVFAAESEPGKLVHFTVTDSMGNGIEGVKITITYQRDGINYLHEIITNSEGATSAAIVNDAGDKTFSYKAEKEGFTTVNGARDIEDKAWGSNVVINMGGIVQRTVTFHYSNDFQGTELTSTVTLDHGSSALSSAPDATREGYDFLGWSEDLTQITSNMTVSALYQIKTFQVTFHYSSDFAGTDISNSFTVDYNSDASGLAPDATRVGYVFTGWNVSLNPVMNDLIATAQYSRKVFEITYQYSTDFEGTPLSETKSIEYGESTSALAPDVTRVGYDFIGWSSETDFVTGELTLVAMYQIKEFNIRFIYQDATGVKETLSSIHYQDLILTNAPDSTITDFETNTLSYVLDGWSYDAGFSSMVADTDRLNTESDITIYGNYSNDSITYLYILNPGIHIPGSETEFSAELFTNAVKVYGAISTSYDGTRTFNGENMEAGLADGVFSPGTLDLSNFITNEGNGDALNNEMNIVWYMVEEVNGKWNVYGYITGQVFMADITINFYQGTDTTPIGSRTISVEESSLLGTDNGLSEILTKIDINEFLTTGYNSGTVASFDTENKELKIVYTVVQTVATPTSTPVVTQTQAPVVTVIEEEALPLVATPVIQDIPEANLEPVVIGEEEVALAAVPEEPVLEQTDATQILDEETPLAQFPFEDESVTSDPVVTLTEMETPLSAAPENCIIHWIILLLTALYTAFAIIRAKKRENQIREMINELDLTHEITY